MTTEQKTVIANFFPTQTAIETFTENLVHLNIFNISESKDDYSLSLLHEYRHFEEITFPKRLVRVFEMFCEFSTTKNALTCLTYISEGNPITDALFEDQGKIEPKGYISTTLGGFFYRLSQNPEMEKTLVSNIDAWYKIHMVDGLVDLIEARQINGEGSEALSKGQIIRYAPEGHNQSYYAVVLSAPKAGWIGLLDAAGFAVLPKSKIDILKPESVPAEARKLLNEKLEKYEENGTDERAKAIERLVKQDKRNQKKLDKAIRMVTEKKLTTPAKISRAKELVSELPLSTDAEKMNDLLMTLKKAQLNLDNQVAVVEKLQKMPLKTEKQIEAAVKAINDAKLTAKNKAEVKKAITEAKKAIKAQKAEAKKKTVKKTATKATTKAKAASKRKAAKKSTKA